VPMSGKEMLKLYEQSGWVQIRQKGSHVIVAKGQRRQVIPMHRELKKGLERALLKSLKTGE
jgi:predicted RNA binding protein YcfA (HicA-like mRNA interferase family)